MTSESQKQEAFKGVFSHVQATWIGTGATRRKMTKDILVYAEETEKGGIKVQELNEKFIPAGQSKIVDKERFVKQYTPEPEIFTTKTLPALRELSKTIAKAERLRNRGEPYTAEFEFKNALKLDETNIRALFGLGLTYLERGEKDQADKLLKEIVKLEQAFNAENKHLFNEFGIKLRKSKMYDQALGYYARALKHTRNDEHLCYNIARTLYDKDEPYKAAKFLKSALAINRNFKEAAEFLVVIKKRLQKEKAKAGQAPAQ